MDSSKNTNFYQFNKLAPKVIMQLSTEKPSAVPLYMLLTTLSNSVGACIISQTALAKELSRSKRTVVRLLNYLASRHFIGIARSGRANVYVLNYNLIWDSYKSRKKLISKYIKFPANVYLTEGQNYGFFKNLNNFIKEHGHKNINLSSLRQKMVKPNQDPNHWYYKRRVDAETGEIKPLGKIKKPVNNKQ